MAEISKVIFQLDVEAQGVFDELNKVAGKYKEVTAQVDKQNVEVAKLAKREKELTEQRAKSTNPTAIVKINAELKKTQDLLAKEVALTKALNVQMDKQTQAADHLAGKMEKAFESSIINSASVAVKQATEESRKLGLETETNVQALKRMNRELQELEPGTAEFNKLAKEAGAVKDKITTAANSVQVFSAASKATQAKTLFGQIVSDLGDLNFADAATKAKQFADVIGSISFKEIVQGAKEFGSTMLNVGKSLLTNPLVLFSAAVAGLSYAVYSLVNAYDELAKSSKTVDEAIARSAKNSIEVTNRRIEAQIKLDLALGKIDKNEAERRTNAIKNQEETKRLVAQFGQDVIALAKENEINLAKLKGGLADERGYIEGIGQNDLVKKRAIKFNKEYKRLLLNFNNDYKNIITAQKLEQEQVEKAAEPKLISLQKEINQAKIDLIAVDFEREMAQARTNSIERIKEIERVGANEVKKQSEINELKVLEAKKLQKELDRIADDARLRRIEATAPKGKEAEIRDDGLKTEFDKNMQIIEDIEKERDKKRDHRVDQDIEAINTVTQAALNAAEQIIQIEIDKQDRLADVQSKRVEQARAIADRGNAELLQQEQERLDAIQKKREQFVRAQQVLQQVEIVGNSIVAVSKAAAQGGVAAPATIAATIAALVAGYALVRTLAQPEGFKEGGYTGDGDPSQTSTALGNRGYTYHKKEFVFNEPLTKKNLPIFRKIHSGEVDLNSTFKKAELFDSIPMPLLNNLLLGQTMRTAQHNIDTSRMENLLGSVEKAIKNKNEATFVFNETGYTKHMKEIIYKQERIKSKAS